MIEALPRRGFLRFELPVRYRGPTLRVDGNLAKWRDEHRLPALIELEDRPPFADVYTAWNEDWFYAAFDVPNKRGQPLCDVAQWWKLDGLRLCIDTRDARDNKRATRFCHFFYLLPTGGGPDRSQPLVGVHRMSRAKEPPPEVDVAQIQIAAIVTRRGYALETAIPARCLNGWNPAEHPRLGFFYKVKDTTIGSQHLTVDDELGWNSDPSTWATAVLMR